MFCVCAKNNVYINTSNLQWLTEEPEEVQCIQVKQLFKTCQIYSSLLYMNDH